MTTYTVTIEEDNFGELVLPIPPEVLRELDWNEGDTLSWTDNHDGTFTLSKSKSIETEWVMVECVTSHRSRYMVEVPKGKELWALDTVSMDEAKSFSRKQLGEHIVSHRVMTKESAMDLCRADNPHLAKWSDEEYEGFYFTQWDKDD